MAEVAAKTVSKSESESLEFVSAAENEEEDDDSDSLHMLPEEQGGQKFVKDDGSSSKRQSAISRPVEDESLSSLEWHTLPQTKIFQTATIVTSKVSSASKLAVDSLGKPIAAATKELAAAAKPLTNVAAELTKPLATVTRPLATSFQGVSNFARSAVQRTNSTMQTSTFAEMKRAEWTQSKTSPATLVRAALLQVPIHTKLSDGIPVTKVTQAGHFKPRILTLSQDRFALFITHRTINDPKKSGIVSTVANRLPIPIFSRKGVLGFQNKSSLREKYCRYIDIADIDFVTMGYPMSRRLEKARKEAKRLKGQDDRIDRKRHQIVTIFYHNGEMTLDLFIPDETTRMALVGAVRQLRAQYHDVKVLVMNEARLVRYVWYDIDKNQDGMISWKEFATMLNRINLHVRQPTKEIFKTFCKNQSVQPPLNYHQIMTLIHNIQHGKYETNQQSLQFPSKSASDAVVATKTTASILLWEKLFGLDKKYISPREFCFDFLHAHQKEVTATEEDAAVLINVINNMEVNWDEASKLPQRKDGVWLSQYRFRNYLYHALNTAMDPSLAVLDHDTMRQPITNYWIKSSHNTYLTGDQLGSASSVECYLSSLARECKCIELDCWDGERHKTTGRPLPVIFHGGTLTSKILFLDVIATVRNYVDDHPDGYPIILSLENHCSLPFQAEMARILKEVLDYTLYSPFDETFNQEQKQKYSSLLVDTEVASSDNEELRAAEGNSNQGKNIAAIIARKMAITYQEGDPLPSPEELRGMVLIKGKRIGEAEGGDNNDSLTTSSSALDDDEEEELDQYEAAFEGFGTTLVSKGKKGKKKDASSSTSPSQHTDEDKKSDSKKQINPANKNILPELSDLTLFHSCKFKRFESSIPLPSHHMHSMSENKVSKLANKGISKSNLWRQYNDGHMTRVYPAGTRIDSSNYNPMLSWGLGCQLVALNFQTSDTALVLNEGRFQQNGNCGYVLKPPSVLGTEPDDETETVLPLHLTQPLLLKVRVMAGSCLPKPDGAKRGETVDPYVEITLHDILAKGGKETVKMDKHTTSTVINNGFNPIWDADFAEFEVYTPDVALLQFSLQETDVGLDDHIADGVIPISCLRQGYRSVLMHNKNGTRSGAFGFATLLVEIRYENRET